MLRLLRVERVAIDQRWFRDRDSRGIVLLLVDVVSDSKWMVMDFADMSSFRAAASPRHLVGWPASYVCGSVEFTPRGKTRRAARFSASR